MRISDDDGKVYILFLSLNIYWNRLHIELPSAFEGSVLIMSKSGTGMAMFSMGEYTD